MNERTWYVPAFGHTDDVAYGIGPNEWWDVLLWQRARNVLIPYGPFRHQVLTVEKERRAAMGALDYYHGFSNVVNMCAQPGDKVYVVFVCPDCRNYNVRPLGIAYAPCTSCGKSIFCEEMVKAILVEDVSRLEITEKLQAIGKATFERQGYTVGASYAGPEKG